MERRSNERKNLQLRVVQRVRVERRFYGASADKEIVKEPVYDVKTLDRVVTRVAREIRLLDQALKAQNAKTIVDGYEQDDAVLGELA
jgi:hypothetical protein